MTQLNYSSTVCDKITFLRWIDTKEILILYKYMYIHVLLSIFFH